MTYTYTDLLNTYDALGVHPGRVVIARSDLGPFLRGYESPTKQAVLHAHYQAITSLLGTTGTLVVPTGTMNLVGTHTPFDPSSTPSHRMGALSEYVRQMPHARRSLHPFVSYAAIGAQARALTHDVPLHAYGPDSVEDRLIQSQALAVSIGLHPRLTTSTVHHLEQLAGVPYRYTKEFMHPVVRGERVMAEYWYLFVWYRACDLVRDENVKLFVQFKQDGGVVEHRTLDPGATIYSFDLARFAASGLRLLQQDPYAWLRRPPIVRPYRD